MDSVFFTDFMSFLIPDSCLHLTYMCYPEKLQAKSGLSDSSSDCKRKLTCKESLMEWEVFSLFQASLG